MNAKAIIQRADHVRRVDAITRGLPCTVPTSTLVRHSWMRCLGRHRLSPDRRLPVRRLPKVELRQRREHAGRMYSIARIEIASLVQLMNSAVGVMMTDNEGVILAAACARGFMDIAQHSGLSEGAVWSEAERGTNGMGTCLVTQEAVLIKADEHFLFANSGLTCCGAPIRNGQGAVVGVINLSGHLALSQAPTLALVSLTAQNIANRTLLAEYDQDLIVRFHPHREFITTAGEGIIAVDSGGRIRAANVNALQWLGLPNHYAICGQPAEQVLGAPLGILEALGQNPSSARPLPPRNRGALCFGIIQPPVQDRSGLGRTATPGALRRAERQTIRLVLDQCCWNVTAAAAQLGISRRTLHRKLRLHGLTRLPSAEE